MLVFLEYLLVFLIILAITVIVSIAMLRLIANAIIYAQITVSLFMALASHVNNPLFNGGLLSFIVWAAIWLGGCFLLCMIPRVSYALCFSCTAMVTWFFGTMVIGMITGLDSFDEGRQIYDTVVKIIIVVFSLSIIVPEFKRHGDLNLFSNPILNILERGLAALIYTIGIYMLLSSGSLLVFIGIFVAAVVADILLLG